MIRLYQFPPVWDLPSASPFCVKLETWLRMTGIEWKPVYLDTPFSAPLGKLPFIEQDGRRMADSGLIIDHLTERHGVRLDRHLDPEQQARALAIRRLIEEHLYWSMMYGRWIDPAGWRVQRREYFSEMTPPLNWIVAMVARRSMVRMIRAQGLGRHPAAEAYRLGCDDLRALARLLGDKPFLMGEDPSSVDAAAFGFLVHILWVPVDNPLRREARALKALDPYCARICLRFYG